MHVSFAVAQVLDPAEFHRQFMVHRYGSLLLSKTMISFYITHLIQRLYLLKYYLIQSTQCQFAFI